MPVAGPETTWNCRPARARGAARASGRTTDGAATAQLAAGFRSSWSGAIASAAGASRARVSAATTAPAAATPAATSIATKESGREWPSESHELSAAVCTATTMASPIVPPTCRVVLMIPEPIPA